MRRVFEAQMDFNYPLYYPLGTAKLGGNVEPPLGSSLGTRILISTQPLVRPQSDTGLDFRLDAGDRGLRMVFERWWLCGIPLPRALGPRVEAWPRR